MRPFALMALIMLALLGGGCFLTAPDERGENPLQKGGAALKNVVAPALPGPLGGIVAGVGSLALLVGGLFAGKKKTAAFEAKGEMGIATLDPITKMFAERKWLFPLMAAFITGGTGANLWHIDPETLLTLNAALGLPAAGEFVKDAVAGKPAPAATAPPPPATTG